MNLEIKIEKTDTGFSAHVIGLPGCVAAAKTFSETEHLINESIDFHLEGLMLRKSIVIHVSIDMKSEQAVLWTFENTPTLFVDIETPVSTVSGIIVQPKVGFGGLVAAA